MRVRKLFADEEEVMVAAAAALTELHGSRR